MTTLNSLKLLLPGVHSTTLLEKLCFVYPLVDDSVAEVCADLLLYAAFGLNDFAETLWSERGEAPQYEELTPQQQRILRLIADRDSLWYDPGDDFDPFADEPLISRPFTLTQSLRSLAYLGLPSTRQSLCAALSDERSVSQ